MEKVKKVSVIVAVIMLIVFTLGFITKILVSNKCEHENVLKTDKDVHYYHCLKCSTNMDKANHSYNWVVDKAPTYNIKGVKHEECFCGVKRNLNTPIDVLKYSYDLQYYSFTDYANYLYNDKKCVIDYNELDCPDDREDINLGYSKDKNLGFTSTFYLNNNEQPDIFLIGYQLSSDIKIDIYIRYASSSVCPISLDIVVDSVRYRYVSTELTSLVNSVLGVGNLEDKHALNFEIFYTTTNYGKNFGFRFYNSKYSVGFDNLGEVTNDFYTLRLSEDTEFFQCSNSNSTSGDNYSLNTIFCDTLNSFNFGISGYLIYNSQYIHSGVNSYVYSEIGNRVWETSLG